MFIFSIYIIYRYIYILYIYLFLYFIYMYIYIIWDMFNIFNIYVYRISLYVV